MLRESNNYQAVKSCFRAFLVISVCFLSIGSYASMGSSSDKAKEAIPNYGMPSPSEKPILIVTVNKDERYLRIRLSNSAKGAGEYTIRNTDKTILVSEEISFWDGSTVIDLPLDDFEEGQFTVTVKFDGKTYKQDFTI